MQIFVSLRRRGNATGLRLKLSLLLLSLSVLAACGQSEKGTAQAGPLPDAAFRARLSVENPPLFLEAGEKEIINVRVRNESAVEWPATAEQKSQIKLAARWSAQDAKSLSRDETGVPLPAELKPGDETEINLPVSAPEEAGEYLLELDMIEGETLRFAQKGSPSLKLRVKVE